MNITTGSVLCSIPSTYGKIFKLNWQLALFNSIISFSLCSDETLEALSDAQVVAPAALTVDLHSADHRNSFLYVFDYQTKNGDYPQVSTASNFNSMNLVNFPLGYDADKIERQNFWR